MVLFVDTLIEYCDVRSKFVHLERTQRSCARAERCAVPTLCPLLRYFRRDHTHRPRARDRELGYE